MARRRSEFSLLRPLPRRRQILETQHFTNQLAALGDIKRLDEALAALQLVLTENAAVYPLVRGTTCTRLAKTRAVADVPAMNVWFMIDHDDESVVLLHIEPSPPEE